MKCFVPKPLNLFFLVALLVMLSACGGTGTSPSPVTTDSPFYIATVDINEDTTEAELSAQYDAKIVSFVPDAGFAVLGFSKEAGELTTLATTSNIDAYQSPQVTMGGYNAWAGGFNAWAGGWNAWAGGFNAWAGGWNAWAGGDITTGTNANRTAWDQIKLEEAHAVSRNFGEGITVAILDTGIEMDHPMFSQRITNKYNRWDYIGDDSYPNEAPNNYDSGRGHGTAVASLILQIAPKATLMPLRVLKPSGKGDTDDLIQAIKFAVDHGADVINISVGSQQYDPALEQMAMYANSKGVMIVASSGNYGYKGSMTYPAKMSYDSGTYLKTIGIGSVDRYNRFSTFTSYGKNLYAVAPGESVTGAYIDGGTAKLKGTSFAAPMFTGAIALALSEMPSQYRYNIHTYLNNSLTNIGSLNNYETGARLLDVEKLIRSLPGFSEPKYVIKNVNSGKCLDISGGSYDNGANILQWSCHGGSNQEWYVRVTGSSRQLVSAKTGKVLDVYEASYDYGANVQQYTNYYTNNQKWNFVDKGDGKLEIRAAHSNKCLDASSSDNVLQWGCHGGDNQRWTLQRVN